MFQLENVASANFRVHLKGDNLTKIVSKNSENDWLREDSSFGFEVSLHEVQVPCDCNLTDFVNILKNPEEKGKRNIIIEYSNFTCQNPPELKGRHVSTVELEELYCKESTCLKNCNCFYYPYNRELVMNCTNKNLTNGDLKNILNSYNNTDNIIYNNSYNITLDLSHNKLTETLNLNDLDKFLKKVTRLNLSYNEISKATTSVLSDNLRELQLHNNTLSRLDEEVLDKLKNQLNPLTLTLHNNPWVCECSTIDFVHFVNNHVNIDLKQNNKIKCSGSENLVIRNDKFTLCTLTWVIFGTIISVFGAISGILAAFYYKYKKQIKIWLYSKQWCLWLVTEDELDEDKKYDAFISFSHKDETFVKHEIVDKLEKSLASYELCLHDRDWLAGESYKKFLI